jgi:hypothetical protein
MIHDLALGAYVRHPDRPDWGLGQVQSVIENRETANFEHAGKQTVNAEIVALRRIEDPDAE